MSLRAGGTEIAQSDLAGHHLRQQVPLNLYAGAPTLRHPVVTSLTLVLVIGLTLGCGSDSTSPSNPPGPPIDTKLTCSNPDGSVSECSLELGNAGGIDVTIQSTACKAADNKLHLLVPVDSVLTINGCALTAGTKWSFPGPFTAGTKVSLQVTSATLQFPPKLLVTGSYPTWTVTFEDGGDNDMNDIILQITATS
jgi:hypothetical protein